MIRKTQATAKILRNTARHLRNLRADVSLHSLTPHQAIPTPRGTTALLSSCLSKPTAPSLTPFRQVTTTPIPTPNYLSLQTSHPDERNLSRTHRGAPHGKSGKNPYKIQQTPLPRGKIRHSASPPEHPRKTLQTRKRCRPNHAITAEHFAPPSP